MSAGDRSIAQRALERLRRSLDGRRMRGACPFCELAGHRDRKHSFTVTTLTGRYSCFRCSATGVLGEIAQAFDHRAVESKIIACDQPPPGYKALIGRTEALCYKPAVDYLVQRGVSLQLMAETQIGAVLSGRYQGRVIVPVTDSARRWVGWVGRAWHKEAEMPYIYPSGEWRAKALYNEAALKVKTDEPAIVVEGVFDALALWPNAVAVLGKPTGLQVETLCTARRPIAIVLDGDAHSEGWALSMRLRLSGVRAGSVRLPPRIDPDEVDKDELLQLARDCLA